MADIKAILNRVLGQSGFLKRGQFFNSSDPDDVQMVEIANRVAIEIGSYYDWGSLKIPHTIALAAGQSSYPLPLGLRWIIADSAWETDGSRKVDMPVEDNAWYQYKFSTLTSGGVIRARKYGDELEVVEPFNGGSITFEYVTEYFVKEPAPTNILKEEFTKDTDTWLLDDQLLTLGIQAHWQQSKMMPSYQEHYKNYMNKMREAISRDAGGQTIGGASRPLRRSPYTKTWVN